MWFQEILVVKSESMRKQIFRSLNKIKNTYRRLILSTFVSVVEEDNFFHICAKRIIVKRNLKYFCFCSRRRQFYSSFVNKRSTRKQEIRVHFCYCSWGRRISWSFLRNDDNGRNKQSPVNFTRERRRKERKKRKMT